MDYKTMTIKDIIIWCKQNDEVDWLKAEAARTAPYKKYPRVKGEDGKMHADKTQEPYTELRPISFMQIKQDFCMKFMPEIIPQSSKKPSMYDIIKSL